MNRLPVVLAAVVAAWLIATFSISAAEKKDTGKRTGPMTMKLESPAFSEGETIPVMYTCDGENMSPPMKWTGVPEGVKSFALIVDDPDAPAGTWVHWVVFDLPPETRELPARASSGRLLPKGALEGLTDSRKTVYSGPRPPSGTHRYFFKLYALDTLVGLKAGATKQNLLDAMRGHILAQAELMGKYRRK